MVWGICDGGGVLCYIMDAESLVMKCWGNYMFIVLAILNEALIVFNSVFDKGDVNKFSLSLTKSNRSLHPNLVCVYSNKNKRNKKEMDKSNQNITDTCTVRTISKK